MRVLKRLAEAREACHALGRAGALGFVPTMGALHEGHLSLVRRARAENDAVAVTIFVNPLQFGPGEDFDRYPRQEDADARLLQGAGADLLLLLQRDEMYPPGFATTVSQPALASVLEGAVRPGHFDGVLTVVTKLLGIAGPCRCYLGRKDYQQTVLVRRLVADLELPAEVIVCDTVREPDGLAMSSRNVFLKAEDRRAALSLVHALAACERRFEAGERDAAALRQALRDVLRAELPGEPDYVHIGDPDDLSAVAAARPGDVALLAARVGRTRLIDNHVLGARIGGPF